MSFVKAISKLCAKGASRQITKIQVSNAGNKAYKETGKQIQATRKQGRFINGSKTYHANKRRIINKAYRNGRDRENFINDI